MLPLRLHLHPPVTNVIVSAFILPNVIYVLTDNRFSAFERPCGAALWATWRRAPDARCSVCFIGPVKCFFIVCHQRTQCAVHLSNVSCVLDYRLKRWFISLLIKLINERSVGDETPEVEVIVWLMMMFTLYMWIGVKVYTWGQGYECMYCTGDLPILFWPMMEMTFFSF